MNIRSIAHQIILQVILLLSTISLIAQKDSAATNFISYIVNPQQQDLRMFWKDDAGNILGSIQQLKNYLESKKLTLLFACNGGMYQQNQSPLGLFIQDNRLITPLNNKNGNGNFYLKPNGVLFITQKGNAQICITEDFKKDQDIKFATQSGPMLLVNGKIHPAFTQGSANVNIRNGVGLLPGNRLLFVMSAQPVNFFDFASYFLKQGCTNALYLDGFVSRTFLPEKKWIQTDGNFGVMIGVVTPEK